MILRSFTPSTSIVCPINFFKIKPGPKVLLIVFRNYILRLHAYVSMAYFQGVKLALFELINEKSAIILSGNNFITH